MHRIWIRLLSASMLLLFSAMANAIPVRVTQTYWEWHFDHAVTSNLGTGADLQIGDCRMSCRGWEDGLEFIAGTSGAPVVSRSRATMQTTTGYSADVTSFNALASIEVFASVHPSWTNAGSFVGAGLDRFITAFEVYEPVLFTGSTGLSEGDATYFPAAITIGSGALLQPGRYFNSLHFADIGTGGWLTNGSFLASRDLVFDYQFSRVAVPAPAPLALVTIGLLAIAAARRRRPK